MTKTREQKNFTLILRAIQQGFAKGDTFDAMESTQAVINAIPQYDNWISVDERLPDEQGYYLVVSDNCVDMGFYSTHDVQNKFINYFNRNFDESVTYWQPLPEPPREE